MSSFYQVWVAENGSVPQTDNINITDAQIAESQINRDDHIARSFRVEKPYVLFARHHWMQQMNGVPRLCGYRFNEMVIYPQIQDALFYGDPMRLSNIQALVNRGGYPVFKFNDNFLTWNIQRDQETIQDFRLNK